jgi:hypothetical protein
MEFLLTWAGEHPYLAGFILVMLYSMLNVVMTAFGVVGRTIVREWIRNRREP